MGKSLSAGKTPRIAIGRVSGDVSVVGWEGEEVLIKADDDAIDLRHDGEDISISCQDDLSVRMPKDGSLSVESVDGDMAIRNVMGKVYIKDVAGDLSVRDVNAITVDNAGSDVTLRGAMGEIRVKNVAGNASLRDVRGDLTLESIADDLVLRDVSGNIDANVGEDAVVCLTPLPGTTCNFSAGADILLVLPPKANATLALRGDTIDVQLPGVKNDETTSREITLGDGSTHISVTSGGEVRVTDQANEAEHADEFGNFAGIHFDWTGFDQKLSRKIEKATRGAKKAAAAVRHAGRHMRWPEATWDGSGPVGGQAAAAREPVSAEERLAILRMLQEKKITADEAEKLLATLEGEAT